MLHAVYGAAILNAHYLTREVCFARDNVFNFGILRTTSLQYHRRLKNIKGDSSIGTDLFDLHSENQFTPKTFPKILFQLRFFL